MFKDRKIIFLDEAEKIDRANTQVYLRTIVDKYPYNQWVLATNHEDKMDKPLIDRFVQVNMSRNGIGYNVYRQYLQTILNKENARLSNNALTKIINDSKGSIRKMLIQMEVLL